MNAAEQLHQFQFNLALIQTHYRIDYGWSTAMVLFVTWLAFTGFFTLIFTGTSIQEVNEREWKPMVFRGHALSKEAECVFYSLGGPIWPVLLAIGIGYLLCPVYRGVRDLLRLAWMILGDLLPRRLPKEEPLPKARVVSGVKHFDSADKSCYHAYPVVPQE